MSESTLQRSSWLYGPATDLLVGCGLLYAASVVVFSLGGAGVRSIQAGWLFPVLVLLISLPHYGATLIRAYESPEDRARYRRVAVGVTLLIVAASVFALHLPWLGCAMVVLFLTWSPWHYAAQNFGISMMFLGRRGVKVSPLTRKAFRASFFLSFVLVALIMHEAGGVADSMVREVGRPSIRFVPLGVPMPWAQSLFLGTLLLYAGSLVVAAVGMLRIASPRVLVPVAALVASQSLWFSIPAALRFFGGSEIEPLDWRLRTYYFMWIALAHAAQYLWITSYFARGSSGWSGFTGYFAKTLAAGTAVFLLPVLVFAPGMLGTVSYDDGLIVLITAAGNLHHFVLDGAIWKLRSRRVRDVLVKDVATPSRAPLGVPGRSRFLPYAIWAVCGAAVCVKGYAIWQTNVVFPAAVEAGDLASARGALDRLAWIGHDAGDRRLELGGRLERAEPLHALQQYERSLELRPTAAAYFGLGRLLERAGKTERALAAYDAGIALAPENRRLLRRAGEAHRRAGEGTRSRELLERAEELAPATAGSADVAPAY